MLRTNFRQLPSIAAASAITLVSSLFLIATMTSTVAAPFSGMVA